MNALNNSVFMAILANTECRNSITRSYQGRKDDITFKKIIVGTVVASMTAGAAMAADIALVIGSNQDAFWNVVK